MLRMLNFERFLRLYKNQSNEKRTVYFLVGSLVRAAGFLSEERLSYDRGTGVHRTRTDFPADRTDVRYSTGKPHEYMPDTAF